MNSYRATPALADRPRVMVPLAKSGTAGQSIHHDQIRCSNAQNAGACAVWSRLLNVSFAVLIGCGTLANSAAAQDDFRRLEPPRKRSAIESLSGLQKKLKESLFGRNGSSATQNEGRDSSDRFQDYERQRRGPSAYDRDYSRYPDRDARYQDGSRSRALLPPQRASQVQYEQPIDYDRGRSTPRDDARYRDDYQDEYAHADRNAASAADQYRRDSDRELRSRGNAPYRESRERGYDDEYRQASAPRQRDYAPAAADERHAARDSSMDRRDEYVDEATSYSPENSLRDDSRARAGGVDYRTGHYQNGRGVTQQQLDQQQTATQRSLRLLEENQKLADAGQAMAAENQRLAALLKEKNGLLEEIEKAITAAREELQKANERNEKLKQQVMQLESENADQALASARQMDAIRKKLDDVLMREITSK